MLKIEQIVALCKNRGFVFQGSEIYGGLANTWDYGPLGVELKNNIKQLWWKEFVHQRRDIVGLDSAILLNPNVWKASGHLSNFSDPLVDCKNCKKRFRGDHLLENYALKKKLNLNINGLTLTQISDEIKNNQIACSNCGAKNFTDARQFNLMFKTQQGVTDTTVNDIYLRPETAQGIFINFKNVLRSSRQKLPFGIAQLGKSFRNEITPSNFIFRTREFEQMEIEYFCSPEESKKYFQLLKNDCENWLLKIGLNKENFSWREHNQKELAHYSNSTSDLEFNFPFGKSELLGLAHRGNYDLTQHQQHSKKDLSYNDETTEKLLADCIEPSLGVERLFFALLCNGYEEQKLEKETRTILKLNYKLAPIKAAVLPLSKKLKEPSLKILEELSNSFPCDFDDSGSIGRRYRRQDEIGTPFCITYDFDSSDDNKVTVRERDSMQQKRIEISQLKNYLTLKI